MSSSSIRRFQSSVPVVVESLRSWSKLSWSCSSTILSESSNNVLPVRAAFNQAWHEQQCRAKSRSTRPRTFVPCRLFYGIQSPNLPPTCLLNRAPSRTAGSFALSKGEPDSLSLRLMSARHASCFWDHCGAWVPAACSEQWRHWATPSWSRSSTMSRDWRMNSENAARHCCASGTTTVRLHAPA